MLETIAKQCESCLILRLPTPCWFSEGRWQSEPVFHGILPTTQKCLYNSLFMGEYSNMTRVLSLKCLRWGDLKHVQCSF